MKRSLFAVAAFVLIALPPSAFADTITFAPTPRDLGDLDHLHGIYLEGRQVNLRGQTITGARLTINNIRNWDNNRNILFIHMLDSARSAGVASFVDDPTNSTPDGHQR